MRLLSHFALLPTLSIFTEGYSESTEPIDAVNILPMFSCFSHFPICTPRERK